jgi:predicted phage terminase large subunit-like protein
LIAEPENSAPDRHAAGQGVVNPIDLTAFKQALYPRYVHADHLELLDRELEQVVRYIETGGKEGTQFLIVEMPPRHGKSLTVSQYLPAWFLGRNPTKRVMTVSYQKPLAQKFGRRVRNILMLPEYQALYPGTRLSDDSHASDSFDVAGTGGDGGLDALGVLGGATGKGAHLLICDDLIRGRKDAESETIRDGVWDAFLNDLLTRLEPGGAVVLMATRWHQDDPIGRVLAQFKDFVRLTLCALIETQEQADTDPLRRKIGEALWPFRYPADILKRIRERLGPYGWSSLYQQNPTPAEGGIFKRKWFEQKIDLSQLPAIVRAVRFWDLAMSEKTSADYTVGTQMVECEDGHLYIVDVSRGQMEWGDVTPHLADTMLADGPSVTQGIEEKGFMSRAVTDLNMDHRLRGYQVWGYPKDTDKLTNALPFAAKCAAGVVHLVKAHWNAAWIDEVCSFPNGTHDDQLDSAAGAYNMLTDGAGAEFGEIAHADDSTIGAWWGG